MKRRAAGGNMTVEAALFIPLLVLLIVGMAQFGKITYQYFVLKKIIYAAARQLSVLQGVDFCDLANDTNAQAAIQLALTDSTGAPIIPNLTADMLQVTTACVPAGDLTAPATPCENPGCPAFSQRPDYVVVSIPNGYQVRPRILYVDLSVIDLRPSVTVPFGGIS
jgi:Flp pilus assembly protein TadG